MIGRDGDKSLIGHKGSKSLLSGDLRHGPVISPLSQSMSIILGGHLKTVISLTYYPTHIGHLTSNERGDEVDTDILCLLEVSNLLYPIIRPPVSVRDMRGTISKEGSKITSILPTPVVHRLRPVAKGNTLVIGVDGEGKRGGRRTLRGGEGRILRLPTLGLS